MKKLLLKLNQNVTAIAISSNTEGKPSNLSANQKDIEKEKEISYQDGYQKGIEDAIAALQEPVTKMVMRLEQEASQLEKKWDSFLKELEPQIITLILKIVEQILQKERDSGNYSIEKMVQRVVAEIKVYPDANILELHCNPEDMNLWQENIEHVPGVSFIADSKIPKSDCVIQTNLGKVIVSWEDRYKQIEKILTEYLA